MQTTHEVNPIIKVVLLCAGWIFGTIIQVAMDFITFISDKQVNTALSSVVFVITGSYGLYNIYNAIRKEITKRKPRKNESS